MKTRRMFMALWPNEQQVDQLSLMQSQYAGLGRQVLPENFHITLLFLGEISHETAHCLSRAAQEMAARPFTMQLNRLGYFSKTKIFWVGPATVPSELESLFKGLRNCAQRCGISKLSKRYTPHVSLLRKCDIPVTDPEFAPIDWHVDEFHLVESRMDRNGARYYAVESFPLVEL